MSENPYQPPKATSTAAAGSLAGRPQALRNLRLALMILLTPAIYNFICFSYMLSTAPWGWMFGMEVHLINGVGLVAILVAAWYYGLGVLERVTGVLHATFARKATLSDWNLSLYAAMHRAPPLAVAGAVLWTIWVIAFYHLGVDFYVVSWPIGILAHLVGAGLYIPLFYRWYQLERTDSAPTSK